MAKWPRKICFPCPECNKWTIHKWVGYHEGKIPAYLIYECEECGRQNLVPIGAVELFTDFSKCGKPI